MISGEIKTWHKISIDFMTAETFTESPSTFRDHRLDVTFSATHPQTNELVTYEVPGFFAADGDAANSGAAEGNVWRVNFTPPFEGEWTYEASFLKGTDIAARTSAAPGDPGVEVLGFETAEAGSFTVDPTDKTGEDFRAKGMILQAEDTHYLQHQGDGDFFIRGGPGVPENLLATADYDGWRKGFTSPDDAGPGSENPNNVARHQFANHIDDFAGDSSDTWTIDSENTGDGTAILGAVDYLAEQGQNTIYLLTNTIGGDGKDVGPWVGSDIYGVGTNKASIADAGLTNEQVSTYDVSKLSQWEATFDYMDERGIYKNVLFQETENERLLNGGTDDPDGSSLSVERKVYMREMVSRFGHNLGIQWNLGEENNNQSDQERADMAAWTKTVDPYDHLVVIHTYPGDHNKIYQPLLDDVAFDGTSFQTSAGNIRQKTLEWREKSEDAGDPWVIAWDEDSGANADVSAGNTDPDETRPLREGMWGHLTAGGSGTNWYLKGNGFGGHSFDQNLDDFELFEVIWDWTEAATSFFNTYIPFWEMETNDAITTNAGDYAMVKSGEYYVVYLKYGQADDVALDLTGQNGKTFDAYWYDPREGGALIEIGEIAGGSVVSFDNPPNTTGKDWVLFVRNTELPDKPASVPPSAVVNDPIPPSDDTPPQDPPSEPSGNVDFAFTLFDAGQDVAVSTLEDGGVIDLSMFANGFNIAADPDDNTVGTVVFSVDGQTVQTENIEPFALFGDTGGNFDSGTLSPGEHTLTATAYTSAGGQVLGAETITVTVVEDNGGTPPSTGGGGDEPIDPVEDPTPPADGEGYYDGLQNGSGYRFKVQIEDAGQDPAGKWSFEDSADSNGYQANFQGDGYYVYGTPGGQLNRNGVIDEEISTFRLYVPEGQEGVYSFRLRVARDVAVEGDKENDAWVGFQKAGGDDNILDYLQDVGSGNRAEPVSKGMVKVYGGPNNGNWGYATHFDGAPNNRPVRLEITEAGYYDLHITGRSEGFHIDSFDLYTGPVPDNDAPDSPFAAFESEPSGDSPMPADDPLPIEPDPVETGLNYMGSFGDDNQTGTAFSDVMVGRRGADTLEGAEGGDEIYGDYKNFNSADEQAGEVFGDTVDGGSGNDYIQGGGGADFLIGGLGDDTIDGDLLDYYGDPAAQGNDTIQGGAGNDVMGGGAGDDSLQGGEDDDVLFGGLRVNAGFDQRDGNDTLEGGGGNDTLMGGAGDDLIDGGTGTDTAQYLGYLYINGDEAQGLNYSFTLADNGDLIIGQNFFGTDTVRNVETLSFKDKTISIADAMGFAAGGGASAPEPEPESMPEDNTAEDSGPGPSPVDGFASYTLIDTENDSPLFALVPDVRTVVDAQAVDGLLLTVSATTEDPDVASAVFTKDGSEVRTENVTPYVLFGDTGGDYFEGEAFLATPASIQVAFFSGQDGSETLLNTDGFDLSAVSTTAVASAGEDMFLLNVDDLGLSSISDFANNDRLQIVDGTGVLSFDDLTDVTTTDGNTVIDFGDGKTLTLEGFTGFDAENVFTPDDQLTA